MTQKKPSTVYPNRPRNSQSPMPQFIEDPSLKGASFDQLLKNRGIRFIHRFATPCPNLAGLDDRGHDPNCTICEDGMLYYAEREIFGVFYGNALDRLYEIQGEWEVGQAVITFPTEYADGAQADFNSYDQLIAEDFLMRLWELKEYQPTDNNEQRLRYPIDSIDYIAKIDRATDTVIEFTENVDFTISNGNIKWIKGREPNYTVDQHTGDTKGDLLTYSFYAKPRFIVQHLMHELRVTQEMDENGQKIAKRLPQQVLVKKDFLVRPQEKRDGT